MGLVIFLAFNALFAHYLWCRIERAEPNSNFRRYWETQFRIKPVKTTAVIAAWLVIQLLILVLLAGGDYSWILATSWQDIESVHVILLVVAIGFWLRRNQ